MKKIVIITAMQEEADHIINMYSLKLVKNFLDIKIYENNKIVLALAGIGKIQASIATTHLFENYDIDKLINIGIAGNLKGIEANIGDVFIVNKIIQHDIYLPFEGSHLDYAKGTIKINNNTPGKKCPWGINIKNNFSFNVNNNSFCLTGDQFIDDENKVRELSIKYNADVIEMEAFAVASVAREYNMLDKCIIIKAISDGADGEAKNAHMNNLEFAMQNSLEVLKQVI